VGKTQSVTVGIRAGATTRADRCLSAAASVRVGRVRETVVPSVPTVAIKDERDMTGHGGRRQQKSLVARVQEAPHAQMD
jgi:hypothetical protein